MVAGIGSPCWFRRYISTLHSRRGGSLEDSLENVKQSKRGEDGGRGIHDLLAGNKFDRSLDLFRGKV